MSHSPITYAFDEKWGLRKKEKKKTAASTVQKLNGGSYLKLNAIKN